MASLHHVLATSWWGSAANQRGMRQYCLLCTRIFDQPKASYLQLSMADTPDGKRFFQASKCLIPPFSANFHPSLQNWSILQLIYQLFQARNVLAHLLYRLRTDRLHGLQCLTEHRLALTYLVG